MKKPIRPIPKFDWFIPIDGDGSHIGTEVAERPPTFDYLREVVQAAERNGFYSMLIFSTYCWWAPLFHFLWFWNTMV